MANADREIWDEVERIHRLLGLALSDTTYMDPRHLEHFTYPLWNTELAQVVAMSGCKDLMVAPQFPMWVSAVELPIFSLNPNNSANTMADGTARSVSVDLAIYRPIVLPRLLKSFPSSRKLLRGMTLHDFISKITANDPAYALLAPRSLWVDELWAPILMEIKKPATRHPDTLKDAVKSLYTGQTDGKSQLVQQATCQACSWRFASQDVVMLIAASHELWSFRRFTRSEAAEHFKDNECFDPETLLRLKDDMEEEGIKPHTQDVQNLLYSNPARALEAKTYLQRQVAALQEEREAIIQREKTQAVERRARAGNRDLARKNPAEDDPEPNYEDRSLPLFSDDEINRAFKKYYKTDEPFFEVRDPEVFFGSHDATTPTAWTGAVRLGTPLSDKYKQFLAKYLKHYAEQEETRRKAQTFHD